MLGVGIVPLPVLIIIAVSRLFGWATIAIDTSSASLQALAFGTVTVFLLEAVPEELVVRGYIYRTLSATRARWKAAVVSVLLFVTIPILIVAVQRYVLGMEIRINGTDRIEPSFLITMLIFGSFLQYLRVLSGTIRKRARFHSHRARLATYWGSSPRDGVIPPGTTGAVHFRGECRPNRSGQRLRRTSVAHSGSSHPDT